jgi:hypothetical protein
VKKFLAILLFLLFAQPVFAQPAAVREVANSLIEQGYFDRCAVGDARACSYFVRLLVFQLNPGGDDSLPGALTKGGGQNIDGYAEDAIAINGNPSDRRNVFDLVGGTGSPGARFQWDGPKERREHDKWEKPRPLSPSELNYLKPGTPSQPIPPIPSTPTVPVTNLQPVLDKLAALEAAVLGLQGDLLDREYVINSIDGFKLELKDIRAQNAMIIEQLNALITKLSEPVVLKGPWGITFKKQ